VPAKTTTRRRTKPAGERTEPAPPEAIPAESPEPEWATEDDLPKGGFRDEVLPVSGKKVRIRFLTNIEATQLALLPDLHAFAKLMSQLDGPKSSLEPEEEKQLAIERALYFTKVAHMAVQRGRTATAIKTCDDCGLDHVPSLWTQAQTKFLDGRDLATIVTWAEQGPALERVVPLSRGQTAKPSSTPANTGESIPAESS
jgi:hypothetical protein